MKKEELLVAPGLQTVYLDQSAAELVGEAQRFFGPSPVVEMEQVHGSEFEFLRDPLAKNVTILGVDGLITNQPGLVLTVRTADCLPILLYHPSGVIGAIHAGRQGTEAGILRRVLQFLKNELKIMSGLKLWFGPAICENCYQIDRDLDLHYSLTEENQRQLEEVFSQSDFQLTTASDCTQHQPEHFSYRRQGANGGRNYSLIGQS